MARRHRGCGPPPGSIPTTRPADSRDSRTVGRARGGGGGGVRPRLPLRPLTPGGPAAAFAAQVALAHAPRSGPGHPHPRGLGRHLRHPGRRRACPPARCCTASPAAPTRLGVGSTSGCTCPSAASSPSRPPTTSARPPPSARSTACWWRPTRRTWRRCPTGANPTDLRSCRWSVRRWPTRMGVDAEMVAEAELGQRRAALPTRLSGARAARDAAGVTDVLAADRRQVRVPFRGHSHLVLVTEVAIVLRRS